jgi:hypothetical protein
MMGLNDMGTLGPDGLVIVKSSNLRQPCNAAHRLLLAILGFSEDEWTLLLPLQAQRAR